MASVVAGTAVSSAGGELDLVVHQGGFLKDVASLEYQVFEVIGGALKQVWPAVVGDRQALTPATAAPAGPRLGLGRYALLGWTPTNPGRHQVHWFYKITASEPEQRFVEDFDVLASAIAHPSRGYCLVADIRDEGFQPTLWSDAWIQERINTWSRWLERVTGRHFEARHKPLQLDAKGTGMLQLWEPVVALEQVAVYDGLQDTLFEDDVLIVFNRHLSQGLLAPDDRSNPKVELRAGRFWAGRQNVKLTGVFGYTDPDPVGGALTNQGITPPLIRHATKLLVRRELPQLANLADRLDLQRQQQIASESSEGQSVSFNTATLLRGSFTGDPEIDQIVAQYRRRVWLASTG